MYLLLYTLSTESCAHRNVRTPKLVDLKNLLTFMRAKWIVSEKLGKTALQHMLTCTCTYTRTRTFTYYTHNACIQYIHMFTYTPVSYIHAHMYTCVCTHVHAHIHQRSPAISPGERSREQKGRKRFIWKKMGGRRSTKLAMYSSPSVMPLLLIPFTLPHKIY